MDEIAGVKVELQVDQVLAGLVVARGCRISEASAELTQEIDGAIEAAKAKAPSASAAREMLRFGRYKPTGRGKPASEYLEQAAREGRFPRINNLVDINNLVSLRFSLPISLIDLDRAAAEGFVIRRGRAAESYVFNVSGQIIDLEDLLLVARLPADEPCANPVKDSMATKLNESTKDVMAVLYAPSTMEAAIRGAVEDFVRLLQRYSGAGQVQGAVLSR